MRTLLALVVLLAAPAVQAWTDPKTLPAQPTRPSTPAPAQQQPSDIGTLSDIKRIVIQIRGVNSREWGRYGLTDTELREAITQRLQQTGFEVAESESSVRDPQTVILDVDVHVNDQAFGHSFLVFLRLKDKLPLPNSPEGYVTKTIWSDWKIGGLEPYNYKKLRAVILDLVDSFLGTYELKS
jgi:hypothetical protein